jgi:hypothetical protein
MEERTERALTDAWHGARLEIGLRVPIEAGERFAVDHDGVPLL